MHQNDGRSSRFDSITASLLNVSQAVALFNIVVGLVVTDVPES